MKMKKSTKTPKTQPKPDTIHFNSNACPSLVSSNFLCTPRLKRLERLCKSNIPKSTFTLIIRVCARVHVRVCFCVQAPEFPSIVIFQLNFYIFLCVLRSIVCRAACIRFKASYCFIAAKFFLHRKILAPFHAIELCGKQ